ncbi:MAG: hypothetical protein HRU20_14725 [Pseudomonadales bacterium]|nr:hypothetical protein [Pseudomonadales bacterium]
MLTTICQLHIIADNDNNILSPWIEAYIHKQQGPHIYKNVLNNSSHTNFPTQWPDIQLTIEDAMQACIKTSSNDQKSANKSSGLNSAFNADIKL